MAKSIIKFQEDPDLLLDMAEDHSQAGHHAKAISLIKRVLKNNPSDLDAKFAFSQELINICRYGQAEDVLFEMLTRDPEDAAVILALGEAYYSAGDWTIAAYYFKRYSDTSDIQFQPDIVQGAESFASDDRGFSVVHPLTKARVAEMRKKAADLIRNGRVDDARDIFKEIEEAFPKDSVAKSDVSFTYLIKNDIENGKLYAQKACELDENNISALCNLAMIYNLSGEKENCEKICQKISITETDAAAEIFKIASTFCEIKNDEMAFIWLDKFLKADPLPSPEVLYHYVFAAFNSGRYDVAKETLGYLLLVNEKDYVAKYYDKELDEYIATKASQKERLTTERWDYYPQIPVKEWKKRLEYFNSKQDFFGVWQDEEIQEWIGWAFDTVPDPALHDSLVGKLAQTDKKKCVEYFKRLLLNQNVSLAVKGKILFCLLIRGVRGRIFIVRDGFFTTIDVPKSIPDLIADAVFLCIAKLSMFFILDGDYPSRVVKVARNVQSRIITHGLSDNLDTRQLAAVIARNCNFEWIDDKKITEVFGVTYKEMTDMNDYVFNAE